MTNGEMLLTVLPIDYDTPIYGRNERGYYFSKHVDEEIVHVKLKGDIGVIYVKRSWWDAPLGRGESWT